MLLTSDLEQLLQLKDFYTLSSTTLGPLKYLSTVTQDLVCDIYRPALEYAFVNEQSWGNIDKSTKKTLQALRF